MERDDKNFERRRYPRHSIKVANSGASFAAEIVNISGSGMELQLTSAINPKTKLIISMRLEEEFLFNGTIMWTVGDYINNQWIYKVGVEIDKIAFEEAMAVTPLEKDELVKSIIPQMKTMGANMISVKKAA